ncbi:MAG: hypothetical protein H6730_00875 [Deltaproteobacteria bacterium]|nr:hypothetical protein [Deltaproteobacteria bacterium]
MNKKIGPGGNSIQRPDLGTPPSKVQAPKVAKKGGVASPATQQVDVDLPERFPGLSAEPSLLHDVIQAGLSSLAKAESWQATDNALGVLVKAMVGASATAKADAGSELPGTLTMEFSRLLRDFVPPGDAGALVQLKKDAQQLVSLAVVALGTEGLEGLSKNKQAAQLEVDVRAIHGALSDVLKLPAEQRSNLLGATDRLLTWKANVLDRSAKALEAAGVNTPTRLDALAGILQIVNRYVTAAS